MTPTGVESTIFSIPATDHMLTSLVEAPGGNFYGTFQFSPAPGNGSVFQLTPEGIETSLYGFGFNVTDAANPVSMFLASDGNLYGGPSGGYYPGSIFKLTPGGTETTLAVIPDFLGGQLVQGTDSNLYCYGSEYSDPGGTISSVACLVR